MSKILVIEDNEDNLDMISRRLTRKEFEVVSAMDGENGLKLVPLENPDLILLDMDIPIVDGWEVARRLKADPSLAPIPVIALTAFAMPGDEARARQAGCDDYASKPVDFRSLVEKIAVHLAR